MSADDSIRRAFETRDIREFLALVFPPEWASVAARIAESGVTMSDGPCAWAPRWSPVPPTVRVGPTTHETAVKSCIYRAHDCIHQLWGLPLPSADFSEEDFYVYKRAQMCGEVAVLTLTEFLLCSRLLESGWPRETITRRNAVPMLEGPLRGRSVEQIAARLDEILHKKIRPKWLRDSVPASAFADDYVPMLEHDRRCIDHNWQLMKVSNWRPCEAPNVRYSPSLSGLELTTWMVRDFYHLLDTDPDVDEPLAAFNRERRASIVLPAGWNEPS